MSCIWVRKWYVIGSGGSNSISGNSRNGNSRSGNSRSDNREAAARSDRIVCICSMFDKHSMI
jgi:hypothetical protein